MPSNDFNLKKADIQTLADRDAIAGLFTTLGYNVERISQTTDALGITNDGLKRHIEYVEQLVLQDGYLFIYLFEMDSMRVSYRQALARSFRNTQGEQLIVVTSDYETIDFVYFEREQPRDSSGNPMRNKQANCVMR